MSAVTQRVPPIEVFKHRCMARSMMLESGDLDLHEAVAVDVLFDAVANRGLVDRLGEDAVQHIVADAFVVPHSTFTDACEFADEEYAREQQRRSKQQITAPLPTSVEQTAEWLRFVVKDPARFERWLNEHSEEQRKAILVHIEKKRAAQCATR